MTKVKNYFWNDVFQSLYDFMNISQDEYIYMPLWYNKYIKIDNKIVFYKSWFCKGIQAIGDLIDKDGNIYEYEDFCRRFNFHPPFTQFLGLGHAIKKSIKTFDFNTYIINQPYISKFALSLVKCKKGCKNIYDLFIKQMNVKPTSQRKWEQKLVLNFDDIWWKNCNSCIFETTKDIKLRWFQYRISHRILSTNVFLVKIGLANNELCSFCKEVPETLEHLFWYCNIVTQFWKKFNRWVNEVFLLKTTFNITDVFFGYFSKNNSLLNLCITIAKFHIYRQKWRNCLPCFEGVKKEILHYKKIEEYIFRKNCQYAKYILKWRYFLDRQSL